MPTLIRHPDYTVLAIGDAWRHHLAPASVLRASYDRTSSMVGRIPQLRGRCPAGSTRDSSLPGKNEIAW